MQINSINTQPSMDIRNYSNLDAKPSVDGATQKPIDQLANDKTQQSRKPADDSVQLSNEAKQLSQATNSTTTQNPINTNQEAQDALSKLVTAISGNAQAALNAYANISPGLASHLTS